MLVPTLSGLTGQASVSRGRRYGLRDRMSLWPMHEVILTTSGLKLRSRTLMHINTLLGVLTWGVSAHTKCISVGPARWTSPSLVRPTSCRPSAVKYLRLARRCPVDASAGKFLVIAGGTNSDLELVVVDARIYLSPVARTLTWRPDIAITGQYFNSRKRYGPCSN